MQLGILDIHQYFIHSWEYEIAENKRT